MQTRLALESRNAILFGARTHLYKGMTQRHTTILRLCETSVGKQQTCFFTLCSKSQNTLQRSLFDNQAQNRLTFQHQTSFLRNLSTSNTSLNATPDSNKQTNSKSSEEIGEVRPISTNTSTFDADVATSNAISENPTLPKSPLTLPELLKAYASLSKFRLSSLVVFSTMVGTLMAPVPFSIATFVWSSVGTSFAVASANAFNQCIEIERDAKMNRTLKRILPTGIISRNHAISFAIISGATGVGLLFTQVNLLTSMMALGNIILYAGIYTPLKVRHPINTWVGSVVGAVPPMIGWAAATGGLEPGAWVLGALLYVWQIPHFLALSWNLRHDYQKAGYKMLSNVFPHLLPSVALRWSIYHIPVAIMSVLTGLTTTWFALDSLAVNAYLIYYARQFYNENSSGNSRKFFFATILHLPLFMALMLIHKADHTEEEEEEKKEEEDESDTQKDEKKEVLAIEEKKKV